MEASLRGSRAKESRHRPFPFLFSFSMLGSSLTGACPHACCLSCDWKCPQILRFRNDQGSVCPDGRYLCPKGVWLRQTAGCSVR